MKSLDENGLLHLLQKNQSGNLNRIPVLDELEFFSLKFPTMERENLRDLKKGIDLTFKDFGQERDGYSKIEGFFGPLLKFLFGLKNF